VSLGRLLCLIQFEPAEKAAAPILGCGNRSEDGPQSNLVSYPTG